MTTRAMNESTKTKRYLLRRWALVVSLAGASLLGALRSEAQVTNVVWRTTISGSLGIQALDQNLAPLQQTSKFKSADLLRMVLGGPATPSLVLALAIDLEPTGTNIFLSIFNKASRQNSRITTNERTTLFQDGRNVVFDVSADIPSSTEIAGGHLRISGRGKVVGGVPSKLTANVNGFLVDRQPTDLRGTTGLVMRATLRTSGAPLRVLPTSGP